ncbi:MAG: GntR family transcriptional regulator [Planctomycetota bacterium]|jgi:DNA-binding LacI/PurR family transcriptional regulator
MPDPERLIRGASLTDSLAERIRKSVTESGRRSSDVVLSERKLAEVHGVSRTTVRRALRKLTAAGWLASLPRRGYRVTAPEATGPAAGPVALVRTRVDGPGEWTPFQTRVVGGLQSAASASGHDLLLVGREGADPTALAAQLLAQGVRGAIVDCDDPEFAADMRRAGLPVVLIDSSGPSVDSVTQDNFGGALTAARYLLGRGHRRIACVTYEASAGLGLIHGVERLGGYLAAMSRAGARPRPEWVIESRPGSLPRRALAAACGAAGGPTAALVLWSEVLDDVADAVRGAAPETELCVWWGGSPELRESWRARHPETPAPAGVAWDAAVLCRLALERLDDVRRDPDGPTTRTLVPLTRLPAEGGTP